MLADMLQVISLSVGVEISIVRIIGSRGFVAQVGNTMVRGKKYLANRDDMRVPEAMRADITVLASSLQPKNALPRDPTHAYVFWRTWVANVKMALGKLWTASNTLQV